MAYKEVSSIQRQSPKNKIKYLSPTSLATFEGAVDKFVLYYVIGLERPKQLKVMAIGSVFDAYVKGAIAKDVLGISGETEKLFVDNLEKQWQTQEMRDIGKSILQRYQDCGAYRQLLEELKKATRIQCEASITQIITHNGVQVPILGKPDLYYYIEELGVVIGIVLDWKVSGYLSKASPVAGYIRLYENIDTGPHRDVQVLTKCGIQYGVGPFGFKQKTEWMDQLHTYSWLCDPVGKHTWILGIDQLVFATNNAMRVASYRLLQQPRIELRERYARAWQAISAEHYYTNVSKDESDARVAQLADADETLRWALTGTCASLSSLLTFV